MEASNTDSRLQCLEIAIHHQSISNSTSNENPVDEAELRENQSSAMVSTNGSTIDEIGNLAECMRIIHTSNISEVMVWSAGVMDTLRDINDVKTATFYLEASSKVYGLRVDYLHKYVVRLNADLENALKFKENLQNDDDDIEAEGESNNSRKMKNAVASITRNKDTLNKKLDTLCLGDPIFSKLKCVEAPLLSSQHLMNNVLESHESELSLMSNFKYWDSTTPDDCDYTEPVCLSDLPTLPCGKLLQIIKQKDMKMRPQLSGYVLSNTPLYDLYDDTSNEMPDNHGNIPFFQCDDMSMAFDMEAECEPMPSLEPHNPLLVVDDVNDFTPNDLIALKNCSGLLRETRILEDLRPIDSNPSLEYSYRPMDKVSQFWAGPHYWKLKRAPVLSVSGEGDELMTRRKNPRAKRAKSKKLGPIDYMEDHEEEFVKVNELNLRKMRFEKWTLQKLKLPIDFKLDPEKSFFRNPFNPSQDISRNVGVEDNDCLEVFEDNALFALGSVLNQTVLEISNNIEGEPQQLTKIVVPFSRLAEKIDMRNLKKLCIQIINENFKIRVDPKAIPAHRLLRNEKFGPGVTGFNEIHESLSELLRHNGEQLVSKSIAFYVVLLLCNEHGFRLIPQGDQEDFQIRRILDG